MTEITLKGESVHTTGDAPKVGELAPEFKLISLEFKEVTLDQCKKQGKKILLNIFPSVDTGVCAKSVKHFYEDLANHPHVLVLHISKDLPFAAKRFCSAEAISGAEFLSAFNSSFGRDYGLEMKDGQLKGLLARAVLIINEQGKITYVQIVPEIGQEPDYSQAIAALKDSVNVN